MNHYEFHCPIKKDTTALTHCEEVHSKSTQGHPEKIEDKICALAHLCWMCPARNAFKVGGLWSHYDKKPRADKPMERPAKLPKSLLDDALSHTTPKDSDYRRCGIWGEDVGEHDALFQSLQTRSEYSPPATPARPRKPAKPSLADVGEDQNDYGAAVTELARKERAGDAQDAKTSADTQKAGKRTETRAQRVSDAPKMTLAERAKLMKQKRAENGN